MELGTVVAQSFVYAAMEEQEANSIAQHTHSHVDCVRCSYNLYGLKPVADVFCPECGEPVANSYSSERLIFADRAWLDHRLAGLVWLCIGCAVFLSLQLGQIAAQMWFGSTSMFAYTELLPHIVLSIGLWKLTTLHAKEPDTLWYEQLIRVALVGYWSGLAVSELFKFTGQLSASSLVYFISDRVLWIALALLTLRYLAHLAQRIPDHLLERFCTITLRLMFWSYLFLALIVLQLQALVASSTLPMPEWAAKVLLLIDPTRLTLLFVVWLLALGWWFRHEVGRIWGRDESRQQKVMPAI